MTNRFEGQFNNEEEMDELEASGKPDVPETFDVDKRESFKNAETDILRDIAMLYDRCDVSKSSIINFNENSVTVLRLLRKMSQTADDPDGNVYSVALFASQGFSPLEIGEMLRISDEGVAKAQEKIQALQDRKIPFTKEQLLDEDPEKE